MKLSLDKKIKINNSIKELYLFQEECGKIGHISSSEWFNYPNEKMIGICENCGEMYERNPTTEERDKYLRILKEPFMKKV